MFGDSARSVGHSWSCDWVSRVLCGRCLFNKFPPSQTSPRSPERNMGYFLGSEKSSFMAPEVQNYISGLYSVLPSLSPILFQLTTGSIRRPPGHTATECSPWCPAPPRPLCALTERVSSGGPPGTTASDPVTRLGPTRCPVRTVLPRSSSRDPVVNGVAHRSSFDRHGRGPDQGPLRVRRFVCTGHRDIPV